MECLKFVSLVFAAVKEKVLLRENVFVSSGKMVEFVMRDMKTANPTAILPQPNLMQSRINRQRQETCSAHPKMLDLDLDQYHIKEDFLVGDFS